MIKKMMKVLFINLTTNKNPPIKLTEDLNWNN